MSLTAAQTRILRDMAGGAELVWTEAKGAKGGPADLTLPDGTVRKIKKAVMHELEEAALIVSDDTPGDWTYALTPAGAAAAGEGAE